MKKKYNLIGSLLLVFFLAVFSTAYSQGKAGTNEKLNPASSQLKTEQMDKISEEDSQQNSSNQEAEEMDTNQMPPAEETEKPEKDNLFTVIKQGGWVMYILLIMFLIGMTLVIERSIYYYKNKVWKKTSVELKIYEISKKTVSQFKEELENELREEMQLYFNDMEKGLNLIHGIGNLSPLIGFFGTVIGMIKAFAAIATAAVVNAKVVAVGIQIALVTTAGGLAVAVLTLSFYHVFAHALQTQYSYADELILELSKKLPAYSEKA